MAKTATFKGLSGYTYKITSKEKLFTKIDSFIDGGHYKDKMLLLEGGHGLGKTFLIRDYVAQIGDNFLKKRNLSLIILDVAKMSIEDFQGIPFAQTTPIELQKKFLLNITKMGDMKIKFNIGDVAYMPSEKTAVELDSNRPAILKDAEYYELNITEDEFIQASAINYTGEYDEKNPEYRRYVALNLFSHKVFLNLVSFFSDEVDVKMTKNELISLLRGKYKNICSDIDYLTEKEFKKFDSDKSTDEFEFNNDFYKANEERLFKFEYIIALIDGINDKIKHCITENDIRMHGNLLKLAVSISKKFNETKKIDSKLTSLVKGAVGDTVMLERNTFSGHTTVYVVPQALSIVKDLSTFMADGTFSGEPNVVLFIDEFNRASKDVQSVLFGIAGGGMSNEYENVVRIGAQNPSNEFYSQTKGLEFDSAQNDRIRSYEFILKKDYIVSVIESMCNNVPFISSNTPFPSFKFLDITINDFNKEIQQSKYFNTFITYIKKQNIKKLLNTFKFDTRDFAPHSDVSKFINEEVIKPLKNVDANFYDKMFIISYDEKINKVFVSYLSLTYINNYKTLVDFINEYSKQDIFKYNIGDEYERYNNNFIGFEHNESRDQKKIIGSLSLRGWGSVKTDLYTEFTINKEKTLKFIAEKMLEGNINKLINKKFEYEVEDAIGDSEMIYTIEPSAYILLDVWFQYPNVRTATEFMTMIEDYVNTTFDIKQKRTDQLTDNVTKAE